MKRLVEHILHSRSRRIRWGVHQRGIICVQEVPVGDKHIPYHPEREWMAHLEVAFTLELSLEPMDVVGIVALLICLHVMIASHSLHYPYIQEGAAHGIAIVV